ncbi:ERO1-like protein beta isoform X2 [Centruroides vittatus]|uniref:ERO1-like protein beta isoform X2 n=1 Tax=Centruroides vittatus TaxID=120091 RepID=UPI003510918B
MFLDKNNSQFIIIITSIFLYVFVICNDLEEELSSLGERCFCKLKGRIDDCNCSVDTVDYFNNVKIHPRLKSLLRKDYFRYFRVNLNRDCPFWEVDSKCAIRDCSVKTCPDEQIPPGIKGQHQPKSHHNKYSQETQDLDNCDENHGGLGAVDSTISDENKEEFARWQHHDNAQENFCELDDETSIDMQYVDLQLNPERYTGYKGASAHRVWKSIYEENCFTLRDNYGPYSTSRNINSMCLEKRAFYRAISGLHTSISIHLCAQHYTKAKNGFSPGEWRPNVEEFRKRYDPELTNNEGPQWLKNLYFVYLLELRAIAKAAPFLEQEYFYTGNEEEDESVRQAIKEILEIANSFPDHFNESVMFSGNKKQAKIMKEEFRRHFWNISRIMDCVGCDKCRLWGKLQVQGLGTAFKILFSVNQLKTFDSNVKKNRFHLTRTEILTLFNAFGRLSNSVYQLEVFRNLLKSKTD